MLNARGLRFLSVHFLKWCKFKILVRQGDSMLRHLTQKIIQTVALKVSEQVAKNDLFEQAGEREPTAPLNVPDNISKIF